MANFFEGLGQFFLGQPAQAHQLDIFRPEQQTMLNQLAQMGMQGMQNPTQAFQPIAQQAQNRFMQQTVPLLSERFTSGTGGRMSSPSFASILGQAGAGLQSDLAGQEAQFGQNQLSALLPLLQLGLQPQFQYQNTEAQGGALAPILAALGAAMGGPTGYAAGQFGGSMLESGFQSFMQ